MPSCKGVLELAQSNLPEQTAHMYISFCVYIQWYCFGRVWLNTVGIFAPWILVKSGQLVDTAFLYLRAGWYMYQYIHLLSKYFPKRFLWLYSLHFCLVLNFSKWNKYALWFFDSAFCHWNSPTLHVAVVRSHCCVIFHCIWIYYKVSIFLLIGMCLHYYQ